MIKTIDRWGKASVTFTLPAAVGTTRVVLSGEWNGWSTARDVLERGGDGFFVTIELEAGRSYRFRYLLDGERWENDWAADAYVPNSFGSEDSVVDLTWLGAPTPENGGGGTEAHPPVDPPPHPSVEQSVELVAPIGLSLPDLSDLVAGATAAGRAAATNEAVYYDTVDLRLTRAGVSLWHDGDAVPAWFVNLPGNDGGDGLVSEEVRVEGATDGVPGAVAELVLATTRGAPLAPVARLRTTRLVTDIRLADGHLLAALRDVTVSVSPDEHPAGRFREVGLSLYESGSTGSDGHRFLDEAVARLVAAGCTVEPSASRLVRVLGEPATRAPDVVVPPQAEEVSIVDLVRHVTARSVAQIIRHDPGARLGRDPEDVHKLRVATRRLRSDLHSFGTLLDPAVVGPVRSELSWLGGVVGAVRDTDVLGARLDARLAALPGGDSEEAEHLRSLLDAEAADARATMRTALREVRYLRLLDALVALAAAPPFTKTRRITPRASRRMAAKIAQKPWLRVVKAVHALGPVPTDVQLHAVRILAKRSRYAAEAAAPLLEPSATRFAAAVADVQTVLGDHQDTVLAEAWLQNALTVLPEADETVKRLIAVERERRVALRAQWPVVWLKAKARKLHTWY